MVFFVDGLLVGWMRDPVALAAISMGAQFGWIANSLFSAIGVSATAMVARYWGARDYERARQAAGQAVALADGLFSSHHPGHGPGRGLVGHDAGLDCPLYGVFFPLSARGLETGGAMTWKVKKPTDLTLF